MQGTASLPLDPVCVSRRVPCLGMANARVSLGYWTYLDLSYLRPTFLALHLSGGLIGLPLLIITLLFANDTPSQPELVNFCITWVINSISYSLSAFKATMDDTHSPLCFAQAAMVQGAPPMTALATFLVVFKIWRTFKNPGQMSGPNHFSKSTTQFVTISLPYVTFVVFFLISVVLQIKIPQSLTANGLYCTPRTPFRRWSVPIFSIFMLALMIGFEVAIAIRYYLARRRIATSFPLARRRTSLGLVIRISLFNAYLFVAFGASIVFLTGKLHPWAYMVRAALPLVAFLLFASQKTVILALCFWRKRTKSYSTDSMPEIRRAEMVIDDLDMLIVTPKTGPEIV